MPPVVGKVSISTGTGKCSLSKETERLPVERQRLFVDIGQQFHRWLDLKNAKNITDEQLAKVLLDSHIKFEENTENLPNCHLKASTSLTKPAQNDEDHCTVKRGQLHVLLTQIGPCYCGGGRQVSEWLNDDHIPVVNFLCTAGHSSRWHAMDPENQSGWRQDASIKQEPIDTQDFEEENHREGSHPVKTVSLTCSTSPVGSGEVNENCGIDSMSEDAGFEADRHNTRTGNYCKSIKENHPYAYQTSRGRRCKRPSSYFCAEFDTSKEVVPPKKAGRRTRLSRKTKSKNSHNAAPQNRKRNSKASTVAGKTLCHGKGLKRDYCGWCKQRFPSSEEYRAHRLKKHSKSANDCDLATDESVDGAFCEMCNLGFETATAYRAHRRDKHDGHICDHCMLRFQNEVDLIEHLEVQHKNCSKPIEKSCQWCKPSVSFKSLEEYRKHRKEVHQRSSKCQGRTYCRLCNVTFKTPEDYREHRIKDHPEELHKCKICDQRFVRASEYSAHKATVHRTVPQSNMILEIKSTNGNCYFCGFEGENEILLQHISNEHLQLIYMPEKKTKQKSCKFCREKFENYVEFAKHFVLYHNSELATCKVCDIVCTEQFELAIHKRLSHPELYPHLVIGETFEWSKNGTRMCETCGGVFDSRKAFINHVVQHGKPIVCPREGCGRTVKISYDKHLRDYHSEGRVCEICAKSCRSLLALKLHKEHVHCEAEFQCTWKGCPKRFKTRKNLTVHMMIHTGTKEKICPVCGWKTIQKASLNYHMEKHHPEDYAKPSPPKKREKSRAPKNDAIINAFFQPVHMRQDAEQRIALEHAQAIQQVPSNTVQTAFDQVAISTHPYYQCWYKL